MKCNKTTKVKNPKGFIRARGDGMNNLNVKLSNLNQASILKIKNSSPFHS